MSVTVRIESPPGKNAPSLEFALKATIRVIVEPEWTGVSLQSAIVSISSDSKSFSTMSQTKSRGLFQSHISFDFTLPDVNSRATITVAARGSFAEETHTLPISVGVPIYVIPNPLPGPKNPISQLGSQTTTIMGWLPWIALGLGVAWVITQKKSGTLIMVGKKKLGG